MTAERGPVNPSEGPRRPSAAVPWRCGEPAGRSGESMARVEWISGRRWLIYSGFMRCDPPEPDDDDGAPSSRDAGDDQTTGAGPEGPTVSVFPAAHGIVVVAVRDALSRAGAVALRHAALAQLARHPPTVIVEFALPALRADHDPALLDAAIAVLIEIAREAADADIGLCLVVAPAQMAPITAALDANTRELFEIHPTITAALDAAP
jgi:hypothetical protein